jgi:polyferredoxin
MEQDAGIRTQERSTQEYRWLRPVVQGGFLVLVLLIGAQFILFVRQLEQGQEPTVPRPPGVEAFLPISALISLKYWLLTGIFNRIHPSGLVLLLVICVLSLVLKRAFCSWVCPFGLLGDALERIHRSLFRRRLSLPRILDYPLRSLKYLLLLFFLGAIFVRMDVGQLEQFINSPYNRIADVKMLKFFAPPSQATVVVVGGLAGLSLVIPFFWCRYLCPYGALLGAISFLGPFKVRRDAQTCVGCRKCSQVCPARIRVHQAETVLSDECHACLRCVDICPVEGTLSLSAPRRWRPLPKPALAAAVVLLFGLGVSVAQLTGHWHNAISAMEYRNHVRHLDHPAYGHNRGTVPAYNWSELGFADPDAAGFHRRTEATTLPRDDLGSCPALRGPGKPTP